MFRYTSREYRDQIAKDIRPVYTAATEAAAKERFVEFTAKLGAQYPAIVQLWENAWSEFAPFLDYNEIRRVICSTNAVESINTRYRRAIRARGHFPTGQAAMRYFYLVTRSLDPTGRGGARWVMTGATPHSTRSQSPSTAGSPQPATNKAQVGSTVYQTAPAAACSEANEQTLDA